MEKEISEDFIQLSNLSITNLLHCLKRANVKDAFITEIGEKEYSKIVKDMRSESTIIGMRDFHNWIKLVLISNVITHYLQNNQNKSIALLDIAVGRGGDLAKWNKAGVDYVYGFDASDKSINSTDPDDPGAKERLSNFKGLRIKDVQFEVGNALQPNNGISNFLKKNSLPGFQIVSCQFALHYFFKTESTVKTVLKTVSDNLVKGGYFIGTTIDSEKVKLLFKPIKEKVYTSKIFRIQRNFPKTLTKDFGNEYSFTIFDTQDKNNYFNTIGISTEYLVNFKKLEEIANEFGLIPVKLNFFEDYQMSKFKRFTETKKVNNSFEDIYTIGKWTPKQDSRVLSPEEYQLNNLYSTFVFQKR